jgi:hypothetical protein
VTPPHYIQIFKYKYLLNSFKFKKIYTNINYSYKADYLRANPPIKATEALNITDNPNNLNIYIEEDNTKIDKLTLYFKERRLGRAVSYSYISINLN